MICFLGSLRKSPRTETDARCVQYSSRSGDTVNYSTPEGNCGGLDDGKGLEFCGLQLLPLHNARRLVLALEEQQSSLDLRP